MDEQKEDDPPQDDHGDPAMPMDDDDEEEEEPGLVDITPAIQALRRMKSTISLLSRAIIRQEAGIARRRTISLMRATRRGRAGRDDVPVAPSENEQQLAAIGPSFSEEEHDRELLSVMSQTLRMVRITSILQDFEEIQEKLLHEFEACMVDLQGGPGGRNH